MKNASVTVRSSRPLVTADIRPISTRILVLTNRHERKTTGPDDTS